MSWGFFQKYGGFSAWNYSHSDWNEELNYNHFHSILRELFSHNSPECSCWRKRKYWPDHHLRSEYFSFHFHYQFYGNSQNCLTKNERERELWSHFETLRLSFMALNSNITTEESFSLTHTAVMLIFLTHCSPN